MLTLMALIVLLLAASAALAQQVPVINLPLSPGQKAPGTGNTTVTVYGTGFDSDAVVKWNGTALTTTFVTSSKLTATILKADMATAGTGQVTVVNGTGAASNVADFQIIKNGYTVSWATWNYSTDVTPQDVTTAEFTTSGHLDLAVATGNNTVSVLLGNGTGSYPTKVQYAVPGNPVAITHGDLKANGIQDLITADQYSSKISVLLGDGDGTFQSHVEYTTCAEPVGLAVADVNGDGKLDVVVACYNANKVSVLLGNGDGTFKTHVDYATGNGPSGVAIGDFNADGKLDLAVPNNTDSTVSILLGNGDGTFQKEVPYATAVNPNSIVTGNFTSSDTLDIALGTSNKNVSVLLGNGDGTFQNHKEYTVGANTVAIAEGDMAAAGRLSLITANYTDNTVSVLVGNGDGTFKSQSIFVTAGGPAGVAVGDFNGDGKLDIAAADTTGNVVSVQLDTDIVLSPTALSFGTVTSGDPSAAKTVKWTNSSTSSYTRGPQTSVGAYCSDFTLTTTCGATLAAGASCTDSVVIDTTASEAANCQYLFTPASGGIIGYQMTGTGNIPISLTPRTQTFTGFQLDGTCSKGKTNTFTNDSGVDIYFTSITQTGVADAEYTFTTNCPDNNGVALVPGASCTSTVKLCPTGSFNGGADTTFIYTGNFTESPQGLLISGEATSVAVTPTTYTFPSTVDGQTVTENITFQNAGNVALPIAGLWFTNGTANVFSVTANTCNYPSGSVPASSSCTITIEFAPLTVGTFTATFNIGDTDETGPQQVSLTGTGTASAARRK
jgi:hypothetical protein